MELWFRSIAAWIITLALLIARIAYIDDQMVTQPLLHWFRIAFASVILWLIFGPRWRETSGSAG